MAHAYPVHLSLHARPVLMVGGGHVARRRLARLLAAGARVRVVAPEAHPEIAAWSEQGRCELVRRAVEDADLSFGQLVLIATDDAALNERVAGLARQRGAWVNRADAPEESDFIVPALADADGCCVSVSSEVRAPSASRRLARELSRWLTRGPARFVREVASARAALSAAHAGDARERLHALAEGPLWDACRAGDEAAITRALATATEEALP